MARKDEKSSSVFSGDQMIPMIIAVDRQLMISNSCLIVTMALYVFVFEMLMTWIL